MMKSLFYLLPVSLALAIASCRESGGDERTATKKYTLTAQERAYCSDYDIDSTLIIALRSQTNSPLNVFVPQPLWVTLDDGSVAEVSSNLKGLYFEAGSAKADALIDTLGPLFQQKGHTIYCCEENFGMNNSKDKVAIVNTTDKYTILKETGTDGVNYDIDNDSLLKIIHRFDEKYDLTLIGANFDWCEFTFAKEPMNWMEMAEECYAVCPDIVDQGTGTVQALAEELERTRTLYFWWD